MAESTVLMFSGQGSQYYQMGRELLENDACFREHMQALDQTASAKLGTSVVEELYADGRGVGDAFSEPPTSNAALLMVEYALASTLHEKGIKPDLVLGASLGTFTAACVSGSITASQALELVIEQGRTVAARVPVGGMVAVLDNPELHQQDPVLQKDAALAGINAPKHFVLAAEQDALDRVTRRLQELGAVYQTLNAARPFHSNALDTVEAESQAILKQQAFGALEVPVICCSLQLPVNSLGPILLWQAVRQPIQFAATIEYLEAQGPHRYIDAGPAGSLAAMLNNSDQLNQDSSAESTLSPFGGARERLDQIAPAA